MSFTSTHWFSASSVSRASHATRTVTKPWTPSTLMAFQPKGPGRSSRGPSTMSVAPVVTVVCMSSSVAVPKMPVPSASHRASGSSATQLQSWASS